MNATLDGFKTKAGRLTSYAFACGYVETYEVGQRRVELWKEHGCYHVRAHDYRPGWGRLFWDSFGNNLTAARRCFDAAKPLVRDEL